MGRKRKPPKPVALSSAEREALLHAAGLELAPDGVRSTGPGRPLVRRLSQLWRNALAARPVDEPTWRELARRKLAQVVREPVSEYLPDPVFAVTAAGLAALWSAAPSYGHRAQSAPGRRRVKLRSDPGLDAGEGGRRLRGCRSTC